MNQNNQFLQKQTFFTSEDDIGLRLDAFLLKKLSLSLTRSRIQSLISSGFVFLAEKPVLKNAHKISGEGHQIDVFVQDEKKLESQKQSCIESQFDFEKMIHYEDEDFFIINKPAGLLSQSKPKGFCQSSGRNKEDSYETSVSELAKNFIEKKYGLNELNFSSDFWQSGREFLVHRLDKETSGLMIIPRTIASYNFFKESFAERKIKKIYKGVVWGSPTPGIHRLENEIRRDGINRMKMLVVTNPRVLNKKRDFDNELEAKQTKTAITNYRVLKSLFGGAMSLVEFEIETGRTHQIRLQMSFFGFPIVCDHVYNGGLKEKKHLIYKLNEKSKADQIFGFLEKVDRHLLHSHYLSFSKGNEFDEFEFQTEDDFSREINDLLEFS